MRRYAIAVLAAALAASAWPVRAQELSSLYGSRNLQYVNLRYAPLTLPYQGQAGEMLFGFNTLSQKTNQTEYKYFYGASLGGGGFWLDQADLGGKFGERDLSSGYFLIQVENKFFPTEKGSVLPYIGGSVGYGSGALWTEHVRGKDNPTGGMDFFSAGIEVGVMSMLNKDYALTVAAGMDARSYRLGSDYIGAYPAMLTVGLCRWRGPLP